MEFLPHLFLLDYRKWMAKIQTLASVVEQDLMFWLSKNLSCSRFPYLSYGEPARSPIFLMENLRVKSLLFTWLAILTFDLFRSLRPQYSNWYHLDLGSQISYPCSLFMIQIGSTDQQLLLGTHFCRDYLQNFPPTYHQLILR